MYETYIDRVVRQSLLWLNGKPTHNYIDGECCVDFSCCVPSLYTKDREEREKLHANLLKELREKRNGSLHKD